MIDYLSARNGKLVLHKITNNTFENREEFEASTAQEVADILTTHGYGESFMCSSSMDFADEDGFDTPDGATNLLHAGFDIIHSRKVA